jgi:hypothetical protein
MDDVGASYFIPPYPLKQTHPNWLRCPVACAVGHCDERSVVNSGTLPILWLQARRVSALHASNQTRKYDMFCLCAVCGGAYDNEILKGLGSSSFKVISLFNCR